MMKNEYGNPPVFIMENGAAFADLLEGNEVHDPKRTAFLLGYLDALSRAIREEADVRGYFLWSLMDNFEWAEGTRPRFGIVYVDYPSQRRVIKDSGRFYARLIRASKE
jgi:beta-glucosidase